MTERRLQLGIFNKCSEGKPDDSFSYVANNICSLYQYYLPKFKTSKLKKVVIEYSDEPDHLYLNPNNPDLDIAYVDQTFDFKQFNISDIQTKKKLLLKSVCDCLKAVFESLGIDTIALMATHNLIVKKNFELMFTIGSGEKLNRKKTLAAKVIVEFFLEYVLVSVIFSNSKNNDLKRIDVLKSYPNPLFYSRLVKISKWLNNDVFQLFNDSKEFNIQVNINASISISYNPKDRDEEGVKEEIEYLSQETYFDL